MAKIETRAELRERHIFDLEHCVSALSRVHEADRYPMVWPRDPVRWLSPTAMLRGWVAVSRPDEAGDDDDGGGARQRGRAERVLGHVLLVTTEAADTVEIARLFVAPEARGLGLGAALLDAACGWAAEQGLKVELEVVADERSSAIALYERTGWRRAGTSTAEWTAPDGGCVEVHRYVR